MKLRVMLYERRKKIEKLQDEMDSLSGLPSKPGLSMHGLSKQCGRALKAEAFYRIFSVDKSKKCYTGNGYKAEGEVDEMQYFSPNVLQNCSLSEPVNMKAHLKIFDNSSITFHFDKRTFSNFIYS